MLIKYKSTLYERCEVVGLIKLNYQKMILKEVAKPDTLDAVLIQTNEVKMGYGDEFQWVSCPICNGKTRIKVMRDTVLYLFPLYCPKCKKEMIISLVRFKMQVH